MAAPTVPAGTRTATSQLACNAAALDYADLPDEVVTIAEQAVFDTVAVTLAARSDPVVRILLEAVTPELAPGESSLLDGSARRVSAQSAALVNGTAAHALDFDDMHPAMIGHPSAPLVPAVLALAEERGSSGRDVVAALVAGYEVQCRIGAAGMPSHYLRGFHPTGTAATFGVAVAAGRLMGLDAAQLALAMGIAGAQAAGLKSMFGTMCKPLHSGKAAANGIFAARLAERGFTSSRDVLTAEQGFFATQTDTADVELVRTPFGAPWYTTGIVFKLYAACGFTHSAIENMLALRAEMAPDDVARVDLLVNPELLTAAGIDTPTTPLEAKFSVRWVTAMALATGSVAASDFTDDLPQDRVLQELTRRIHVRVDPSGRLPRLGSVATITSRSGRTWTRENDGGVPPWVNHPAEQRERLRMKFRDLVDPLLDGRGGNLADDILALRSTDNVRSLVRALAG